MTLRERCPPTSILASAGSGKTYQLTSRYLALIAAGAAPGTVLATTFTRLAAGEIRDRVLLRLAAAAADGGQREALAQAVGRHLDAPEVLALLRALTAGIDRLRIGTLDSFFASVVTASAVELGLPPGVAIVDETTGRRLREEAVRRMLAAGDPRRLVSLLGALVQGRVQRSVVQVVDRTVAALHEIARAAPPEAWDRFPRRAALAAEDLAAAIDALEAQASSLPPRLAAAAARDLRCAAEGDWEALVEAGIAARVAAGAARYGRVVIPPALAAAYRPLLEHAAAVLLARLRGQTRATGELLRRFDACDRQVKREQGAMTFADLSAALSRAHEAGRGDGRRLFMDAAGGAIDHLLLDEFQDTNVHQWRALAPLAAEILGDTARPRTFFCVGDVKQSIYGWRDACPEVLDSIADLLPGPDGKPAIVSRRMSESRRSAPVVIDVVNRVFGTLTANPALAAHPEAAELFAGGFAEHTTTRTALAGRVELRVVERAGEGEDPLAGRERAAAALASALHAAAGGLSIALLTRTNDAVARLLFALGRADPPVAASGRGGGPLTDTAAVNAVLDLCRLADHPDDTVAAFNIARGPLGAVLDFTDEGSAPRRRAVAGLFRRRLMELGSAETVAGLARQLAGACAEREERRLLQLVELAGRHDEQPTLRPGDFVRRAETERVAEARPAPVTVMTMHQAKGLEFDAVILPELEWPLAGSSRPPLVFERRGAAGPITRVCRWTSRAVRGVLPELAPMFDRHRIRAARESLCLLYVAITRARQGLYMFIDPPAPRRGGGLPATAAGVLRGALIGEVVPGAGSVAWAGGEEGWHTARPEAPPPPPAAPAPRPIVLAPARETAAGTAASAGRASSPGAASEATALAARLGLDEEDALERGRVLHALFAELTWREEWRQDRPALVALARCAAPRREAAWIEAAVEAFLAALERPAVRRLLSRGEAAAESMRVWTERPFARRVAEGVQQGRIDRVTARVDEQGRAVAGAVIELKSDAVGAADAAVRAERYRGQLTAYRQVAAGFLGLAESAVEMIVLFAGAGEVVSLAEPAASLRAAGGGGQAAFEWAGGNAG